MSSGRHKGIRRTIKRARLEVFEKMVENTQKLPLVERFRTANALWREIVVIPFIETLGRWYIRQRDEWVRLLTGKKTERPTRPGH